MLGTEGPKGTSHSLWSKGISTKEKVTELGMNYKLGVSTRQSNINCTGNRGSYNTGIKGVRKVHGQERVQIPKGSVS